MWLLLGNNMGFISKAPRFKGDLKSSVTPGPGSYTEGKLRTEEDLMRALEESNGKGLNRSPSNPTAAFRSESRLKHSMMNLVRVLLLIF